jgi:nicotinamidase/pyrazinamidase
MEGKIKIGSDSALLLVEPQKGFTRPDGSFHLEGVGAVCVMNKAMEKAPWTVLSIDWHPEDHVSFDKFGLHCIPGTPDAELDPYLKIGPIKAIFMKGTGKNEDIYDSFLIPGLKEYLVGIGKKTLFIAGSAIPICPSDTAISGAREGFKVYLVWDACVMIKGTDEEKEKERLKKAGVAVINYDDLE